MRRGAFLILFCLIAVEGLGARVEAGAVRRHTAVALHDKVAVRARPSPGARVLATLVQQTQVEVLGTKHGWSHVTMWASVKGWVLSHDLGHRKQWNTTSTYRAPVTRSEPLATGTRAISTAATVLASTPLSRTPGGPVVSVLPPGKSVKVSAWRQDAKGAIWYRISQQWARGSTIQLAAADPGLAKHDGIPLWHAVAGKGMWLTLGTVTGASPQTIVLAARRVGITHLYVEAAISPLGFHGRGSVAPLIEAAHHSGIAMIAWVYPYLDDIASDVQLTRSVIAYRTPGGDRFDGVAVDLERNMDATHIRTYSQLLRAYAGDRYLLVGVSYPPQSLPDYPFAVLAHSYNAIAPMDYWHQTKTPYGLDYGRMPYGYAYGYRYAEDSVSAVRRVSGHVPITTIGQTFDDFGRFEMGPHAPSAAELNGFLRGSKHAGAIGTSFFQWMTATDGEWRVIRAFRF